MTHTHKTHTRHDNPKQTNKQTNTHTHTHIHREKEDNHLNFRSEMVYSYMVHART